MWAYIDESGNTGNRIFDQNQPVFIAAAMATKTNFDLVYGDDVAEIAKKAGVAALHANELGVGRIEMASKVFRSHGVGPFVRLFTTSNLNFERCFGIGTQYGRVQV